MAKNSGSFQVGALKNTPKFTFTISSSLINKVEGVKYGLSVFFYTGFVSESLKDLVASRTSAWFTLPATAITVL
jgi:hypothetical protein